MTSGVDDIDASIRVVLLTAPGERVMRPVVRLPHLGAVVRADQRQHARADGRRGARAIGQWEPRVELEEVELDADPGQQGRVLINITYRVRATNDRRNLVYPFYVIPRRGRDMTLARPQPRRPQVPGHRRRGQAADPTLLPGVDEPQPLRPRRRAHRAVRVDDRDDAVPGEPGARRLLHAHARTCSASSAFPRRSRAPTSRSGSSARSTRPSSYPAGTPVATAGDIGVPRVFTTLTDLTIRHPTITFAAHVERRRQLCRRLGTTAPRVRQRDALPPVAAEAGRVLLPRLRRLARRQRRSASTWPPTSKASASIPDRPPLRWEVWQGEGWIPATVYDDSTGGLNRDGTLVLLVPAAHEALTLGGQRAFWLRARLLAPEPGQPTYQASPQVRSVRAFSVGGTVAAEHSARIGREVGRHAATAGPIRRSSCSRFRCCRALQTSSSRSTRPATSTTWVEVADFVRQRSDDRHFVWDSAHRRDPLRSPRSATPTARPASTARSRPTGRESS